MRSSRLRTALLASGAAVALAATSGPAAADDLQSLRDQLEKLQNKVAKIEADRSQKARKAAAAASVEAGAKPKSWKLPGTNTSMIIGGYVKLDLIWDFNSRGAQLNVPAAFPRVGAGNAALNGGAFQFHSRQSRIFVLTSTPTDWGELTTRFEGDFFGGATGQNAPLFRLRHAFGCLGPVCAGQTWSTFMPVWAGPEVLDFAGPVGAIFVRQSQLRFTHAFGGGWVFQIALESPTGTGAFSSGGGDIIITPGAAAVATGAATAQQWPDVVAAIAYNAKWGRIWLGGIIKQVENGLTLGTAGHDDSTIGWGVALAGAFKITKRLRAGFQGVIGAGTSAYQGFAVADVALSATGGMSTILYYGGYGWVQWRWTDTIRSTVAYGFINHEVEDELARAAIAAGTEDQAQTVHVNLIWSPVPAVNIGVEFIYTFRHAHNAANNTGYRLHFGFQYKF